MRIVVACAVYNANGCPDFAIVAVKNATNADVANGKVYDAVRDWLRNEDYENPDTAVLYDADGSKGNQAFIDFAMNILATLNANIPEIEC